MTINDMISELVLRRERGDITGEEIVIVMDGYGDTRELEELEVKNNELQLWS